MSNCWLYDESLSESFWKKEMNSYPSEYDVEIGEIGRRNGANSVGLNSHEGSTPSSPH